MDSTLDPLAALRGIHVPPPPHWWPPAPGWWLLAALLLLLLVLCILWIRSRRRSSAPWRAAQRELAVLWEGYRDSGDQGVYLRGLSVLLRRAALARLPAEQVAGLGGEQWLALLDSIADSDEFTNGAGRVLADGPYAPSASFEPEAVHSLARRLLTKISAYRG